MFPRRTKKTHNLKILKKREKKSAAAFLTFYVLPGYVHVQNDLIVSLSLFLPERKRRTNSNKNNVEKLLVPSGERAGSNFCSALSFYPAL